VVFVFALEVLYFCDGALDVFNVLFTNVYKPRPTRRKIFLWKKADLENMGKQLDTEFSKFNTTEFKDINSMWSSIKQLITESINKGISFF
jgi:hypothetical protein